MAATGQPIIGRGPVQLGALGSEVPVAPWASYTITPKGETADAPDATLAHLTRLWRFADWTATIEATLATTGRILTIGAGQPPGLSIGSYAGVSFKEHTLTVDAELKAARGGTEDWMQYAFSRYQWQVKASKWEAVDSLDVFLALLRTQAATPYASVAYASKYASGSVLFNEDALKRNVDDAADESLSCMGSGELTSTDPFIMLITATAAESVANEYAEYLSLIVPEGAGPCYVKQVEYTVPGDEPVKLKIELQGCGAFAAGIGGGS